MLIITAATASVGADMLARTWREIDYHLDILHVMNDAHVEVY